VARQIAGTEKSKRAPGASLKMSSMIVWGFSPWWFPSQSTFKNAPEGAPGRVVVNVSEYRCLDEAPAAGAMRATMPDARAADQRILRISVSYLR
jgi:hypothetical protein